MISEPPPTFCGFIDRRDEEFITGWATYKDEPGQLRLEILHRGAVIGQCIADQFRKDLFEQGISDGWCAFRFKMPAFFPRGEIKNIEIRIKGSGQLIGNHSASKLSTKSRFGGLWIDQVDFLDVLALKHRVGELDEDLATQIFKFVRDGYLILPSAVPKEVLDQVDRTTEAIWMSPPTGLLIETFEPDGKVKYIPPRKDYREGRTKLLDVYAFSAEVRTAIARPFVMKFLKAIFQAKPKAFQSLTFWRGSQQAIHKDTAYVKVDTNPMHLAATWLALEDVDPGAGELEYYVGSHRSPDFYFGGWNKWIEGNAEEHPKFLRSLHEDASRLRQPKKAFFAKRGDVLIWHADLAHGGATITQPERTRKSLVTHFTTCEDEPYYRRKSKFQSLHTPECDFVSQYADVRAQE